MANLFSNIWNNALDGFAHRIANFINDSRTNAYGILGNYYSGNQRAQLKAKNGEATPDNIILNFVGLAVDRAVSRLFRGGVVFKLPDGKKEQQDYIDATWKQNRKEILMYQLGLHGAVYGMPFVKIVPDGLIDPLDPSKSYPQLIALDPDITRVKTDPQDMNKTILYQIAYKLGQNEYVEVTCRSDYDYQFNQNTGQAEPVALNANDEANRARLNAEIAWRVEEWERSSAYGNQLTKVRATDWPYNFPPIHHWKNLPSLKSAYGDSDIDDAINVQDKANFVASNTGKIIKHYAHPITVAKGVSGSDNLDVPVGGLLKLANPESDVFNVEFQSDLGSSSNFLQFLRQSIFDTSREVDTSSLADKAGQLTNFGLRVLWTDALDKNDTKRQLYGDAFREINRRLLVLSGKEGADSDPGDVQWGDPLPTDIQAELTADETAMRMGLVDKETVYTRYKSRYGLDWTEIEKRLKKQQEDANQQNENLGGFLLRKFNRGGEMPQKAMQNVGGENTGRNQPR